LRKIQEIGAAYPRILGASDALLLRRIEDIPAGVEPIALADAAHGVGPVAVTALRQHALDVVERGRDGLIDIVWTCAERLQPERLPRDCVAREERLDRIGPCDRCRVRTGGVFPREMSAGGGEGVCAGRCVDFEETVAGLCTSKPGRRKPVEKPRDRAGAGDGVRSTLPASAGNIAVERALGFASRTRPAVDREAALALVLAEPAFDAIVPLTRFGCRVRFRVATP